MSVIINELTKNVEIVQTLSTYPNQEDGLSDSELKAKFDEGAKIIKEYLNGELVPAVKEMQESINVGSQYGLDSSLSVEGRAADAKATGEAINALTAADVGARPDDWMPTAKDVGARPSDWMPTAAQVGAAPAGVGFGENMLSRSSGGNGSTMAASGDSLASFQAKVDLKLAEMENYSAKLMLVRGVSSLGNFYGNCGNCLGILYRAGSENEAWLIALSNQSAKGSQWRMRKGGGTWSDPEWEHPPMVAGTEYRTTERYNEKPVYAKAVNCGAAPKNTRKNVAHGISNLDFVVSFTGCMVDSQSINALPTEWSDGSKCFVASVNATNIAIQSNFDFSSATITVILKYTKA